MFDMASIEAYSFDKRYSCNAPRSHIRLSYLAVETASEKGLKNLMSIGMMQSAKLVRRIHSSATHTDFYITDTDGVGSKEKTTVIP